MWLGKNVSLRQIMVGENVRHEKRRSLGKSCVPKDGGRDGAEEKTIRKRICGPKEMGPGKRWFLGRRWA